MSLRYGRKISELTPLTASSEQTYVLGIDGDTSYKLPAIIFQTAVGDTALGVVNGRLNNIESATGSYLTDLPTGVLSSSAQITQLGFISSSQTLNTGSFATTGSNIFIGNQTITGSIQTTDTVYFNNGIISSGSFWHIGESNITGTLWVTPFENGYNPQFNSNEYQYSENIESTKIPVQNDS